MFQPGGTAEHWVSSAAPSQVLVCLIHHELGLFSLVLGFPYTVLSKAMLAIFGVSLYRGEAYTFGAFSF